MKKLVILTALLMVSVMGIQAQNDFVLTEQLFSRIATNPAGTGNSEDVNIFSLNRFQYAGVDGYPFSTLLNVHSYFDKANSGIGLTFSYDGSGVAYRQINAKVVYAYHLNFGKGNIFSFGLGLGVVHKNFDPSRHILEDETERGEGFPDTYQEQTNFDASFGIEYSNKYILAGVAINHIPGYAVAEEDITNLTTLPSYSAYVRGTIPCGKNVSVSPAVSYFYTGQSHVVDVNVTTFFAKYFWAGLGYRTLTTGYINVGFEWEWLRIGYACDINFGELSNVASTSHEVMLSFSIPTRKPGPQWED